MILLKRLSVKVMSNSYSRVDELGRTQLYADSAKFREFEGRYGSFLSNSFELLASHDPYLVSIVERSISKIFIDPTVFKTDIDYLFSTRSLILKLPPEHFTDELLDLASELLAIFLIERSIVGFFINRLGTSSFKNAGARAKLSSSVSMRTQSFAMSLDSGVSDAYSEFVFHYEDLGSLVLSKKEVWDSIQ